MNGWIKLHKQIIENDFLQNDMTCYVLFTKLLLVTNTKTGTYTTGRFKLESLTGLQGSTIYKALKRLENNGLVTQVSNNRFTTISICNWKKYQGSGNSSGNNQVTTKSQPSNTNKDIRTKKEEVLVPNTPKVVYGNKNINDAFNYWLTATGIPISSKVKQNRNACNNLYKRYGKEKLEQLINGVAEAQSDKYAPRISDFVSLQAKLSELLLWGKQKNNTGKIVKI